MIFWVFFGNIYLIILEHSCKILYINRLFSDVDECLRNPCYNGGNCSNTVGSFECICQPGWTGPTCLIGMYYGQIHVIFTLIVLTVNYCINRLLGHCNATHPNWFQSPLALRETGTLLTM